jgi:6-pyruvoyltetrahydropterin/6-carboxytetrahydropterin synthase
MPTGYMTRKHKFDAAHRVMFERVKCFNMHGHEYHVEVTLSYDEMHSIGYAIDLKEIRRLGLSYLDKRFDHGAILNPLDVDFIEPCIKNKTKIHIMNLMGPGQDCNPSAENIAKEVFFAMSKLLDNPEDCNLKVHKVRLYETINCYVDCYRDTLSSSDWKNLEESEYAIDIQDHKTKMGTFEYDVRKVDQTQDDSEEVAKIDN